MKRKLLSMVLTIGVLLSAVGCGQTESPDMSDNEINFKQDNIEDSNEIQPTILTELKVGESTANDVESYLDKNNIAWESNIEEVFNLETEKVEKSNSGYPDYAITPDKFLDYEYSDLQFRYSDFNETRQNKTLAELSFNISLIDADSYKQCISDIKDYLSCLNNDINTKSTESGNCWLYLIKDDENYPAIIFLSVREDIDKTIVSISYTTQRTPSDDWIEDWKDNKGNIYTPKYFDSIDKDKN